MDKYRLQPYALPLILILALLLRLWIAPQGGHPGDLPVITAWAEALHQNGWLRIYQTTDANYPPLGMLLIALSRWGYGLLFPGAALSFSGWWPLLLKLPAIVADLGIVWLVWRRAGQQRAGHRLALVIAFHPVLLHVGAWWGQSESVYAFFALAAVLAFIDRRLFRSGVLLGIGVLVKLQAVVILPLLVLLAMKDFIEQQENIKMPHCAPPPPTGGEGGNLITGFTLPLILTLLPFFFTGQIGLVVRRVVALVSGPGWPTVNALNFWYLITGGAGNWVYNAPFTFPDTTPLLFGIPAHRWGLLLLGGWSLLILILGWRGGRRQVLLSGALLAAGFFLWPTQAHERYAFLTIILLTGHLACEIGEYSRYTTKRLWIQGSFYAILSLSLIANLLWAAPPFNRMPAGNVSIGLIISALHLVLAGVGCGWLMADSNPLRR